MKRKSPIALAFAALSLTLFCAQNVHAQQPAQDVVSSPTADAAAGAQNDAMQMVPAQADLAKQLDAKKVQSGHQFQAVLNGKVKLKNGPELERGTVLIGTVAADDMHAGGDSKLTLRFTEAKLKDGKVVPIKATIVGIYPPNSEYTDTSNVWSPDTLRVDQIGAVSGVDLHSRIASSDSGVLEATKKDDVKLAQRSSLDLAIEAQPTT
jgi:hypothetical protein